MAAPPCLDGDQYYFALRSDLTITSTWMLDEHLRPRCLPHEGIVKAFRGIRV